MKKNIIKTTETRFKGKIDNTNEKVQHRQASKVWEQMKTTPSVEDLDKIIPMNMDFIKSLMDVIVRQIETDGIQYENYMAIMHAIQTNLSEGLKDRNVSREERIKILELLSRLATEIAMVEKTRIQEDVKTKRVFGLCGVVAVAIAFFGGLKYNKLKLSSPSSC